MSYKNWLKRNSFNLSPTSDNPNIEHWSLGCRMSKHWLKFLGRPTAQILKFLNSSPNPMSDNPNIEHLSFGCRTSNYWIKFLKKSTSDVPNIKEFLSSGHRMSEHLIFLFLRWLKANAFNVKVAIIALTIIALLAGLAGGFIWWRISNLSDAALDSAKFFGDKSFARAKLSFAGNISFSSAYDKPLLMKFADFAISILPIGAQSAKAQTTGNIVKYIDAYQNTDVVQTRSFNKLKEDIILKQPGHPKIFEYQIDMAQFDVSRDSPGNLYFFRKGHVDDNDYKLFTIPAPFMIDADGKKSSTADVLSALNSAGRLVLKPSEKWLAKAKYPVVLDPTVEITVLTVHSHPQQNENWTVDFTTQGTADLKIIPNDQATIDDDEFVSLSCNGEKRQAQILAGDIIYYPNWNCSGTGQVVHYTKTAGKHTLRFEFGLPGDETNRQISYAYNTASSPVIFRSAAVPPTEDQYTKLLIHANETSGSASFADSEPAPTKTITASGNASTTNAQTKFGNVAAFDGAGDYLSLADSDDWNFGSGDFTIDFWVKFNSTASYQVFMNRGGTAGGGLASLWFTYTSSNVNIALSNNGSAWQLDYSTAWSPGTSSWHHVALVRTGTTVKIFADGAQLGTDQSFSGSVYNPGSYKSLFIGTRSDSPGDYPFNGYIDELRVSKGIARWTSNFTPPTSAYSSTITPSGQPLIFRTAATDAYTKLLLHADGTGAAFVDSESIPKAVTAVADATQSATQSKFGGKSAYFDGTGDYLSLADSADWDFGTGNFTIDFWVYPTAHSVGQYSFAIRQIGNPGFYISAGGANQKFSFYNYSLSIGIADSADIPINEWSHVALVRNGNTWTLYRNGTSVGTPVTNSGAAGDSTGAMYVGGDPVNGSYFTGYLDELRISKGIARWTSNFTPPTSAYSSTGSTVIFK